MIIDPDYYASNNPLAKDYTVTYYEEGKAKSTIKPFQGSDPSQTTVASSASAPPLMFQKDCGAFSECPSYGDTSVTCDATGSIRWFDRPTGEKFCTKKGCETVADSDIDKYSHAGYYTCSSNSCPDSSLMNFNYDSVKKDGSDYYFQSNLTKGVCWPGGNYDEGVCPNDAYYPIHMFGKENKQACRFPGFVPILHNQSGWHNNDTTSYLDVYCCDPIIIQKKLTENGKTIDDLAGNVDSAEDETIKTILQESCGSVGSGLSGKPPILGIKMGDKNDHACTTGAWPHTGRSHCQPRFLERIKNINANNLA